MKICIINNIYPPYHRGGAEQVVVKTVEGLIKAGHEVIVITSTPEKENFQTNVFLKIYQLHPKNIYFYTEGHKHNFLSRVVWHALDIFNFGIAKKVKNILEKEKPDIVHTHNLMGLSFLIPSVIRELKIKHLHTVHDVQLVEPSGMILKTKEKSWRYNGLPTKIYTWLMKQMMGSPEVVISPSQFLLGFYGDRGLFEKSNFIVLRNPLTFSEEVLSKKNTPNFNFLYVGQIEEHKGILFLTEAFVKHLANNDGNCKLHIVGGGSQLEKIKQMASLYPQNILIYGRKQREELPELFSKMDMTIVPSLCYENSPTVIFESLYFEVPVLASNIEGIAELIQVNINGLTFKAGDSASLVDKIKWCTEHKEEIEQMSGKTKETVVGYSVESYVDKLVKFYSF